MAISRALPRTFGSRLQTLLKAQSKVSNVPTGGNILSAATTTRLSTDLLAYQNGNNAIIAAIRAKRNAILMANPQRILLKEFCNSYIKSINNGIRQKVVPAADRAFFGLDTGNSKLPKITTDLELLTFAALIISGDAKRITAGGIVMSLPSIKEFTDIYVIAAPLITAVSNAKTALTDAEFALNRQSPEIDDCILHIWTEVESHFSLYSPSAKRSASRPWSVRYLSKGVISIVTGKITNSISGAGLAGATVRITGGKAVKTDAAGNFSINTSMYCDLELTANLINYLDGSISFVKEDGVSMIENLALVAE